MKKVILEMSVSEIERLKIIGLVMAKSLTQVKASEEMGVGYRQVKRIVRRIKEEGDIGVIHRLRGRVSGRQISGEKKSKIAELYRTKYPDFGTTFFNSPHSSSKCNEGLVRRQKVKAFSGTVI